MVKIFLNRLNVVPSIQLFKNFSYLLLANGINFILPVIIVPYLIKTIGIDNLGKLATAQAFMILLMSITDYSFNITGAKSASLKRNNPLELQDIFNSILGSKVILLIISFIILALSIELYPRFKAERLLFYLSFGMVIGRAILPTWFFQGIEKMQFVAYFNFISKIILTASILLLVSKKENYFFVNFLYGIGDILTGIVSLVVLSFYHKIKIKRVSFYRYTHELKNGFGLFFTNISLNLASNINILILSSFVSSNIVGMYSVAEKVMLMSKQLIGMISQAIFPHVCKIAEISEKKLIKFMKSELALYFFFFSFVGVVMILFADKISFFFNKRVVLNTALYIKYFSAVPLIVSLNMPISQYLLVRNYQKQYIALLLSTTMFCIFSNYLLVPSHGSVGTIISIVLTEILVTLGLYAIFIFNGKKVPVVT
jgi:PST family polysaccharide transporter